MAGGSVGPASGSTPGVGWGVASAGPRPLDGAGVLAGVVWAGITCVSTGASRVPRQEGSGRVLVGGNAADLDGSPGAVGSAGGGGVATPGTPSSAGNSAGGAGNGGTGPGWP